jgi:hypothetical protein
VQRHELIPARDDATAWADEGVRPSMFLFASLPEFIDMKYFII